MSLELKGEHLPENDDSKPIFVAIMRDGTLEVIRVPTEHHKLGKNPDVHDYMNEVYSHDFDWMVVNDFRNIQLEEHINHDLNVGDLVITTNDQEEGDFMEKGEVWVHADGYPTVRFKKSGTATLVAVYELVVVKDIANIPLFAKEIEYVVK